MDTNLKNIIHSNILGHGQQMGKTEYLGRPFYTLIHVHLAIIFRSGTDLILLLIVFLLFVVLLGRVTNSKTGISI